jgi:hypothetical protein
VSAILAVLTKLFAAALGEAVADLFKAWQANQDAKQVGRDEVTAADAQAIADKEKAYAQIATDAGGGGADAAAGRLSKHTF